MTTSLFKALADAAAAMLQPLADASADPAARDALLAEIGWDLSAASGVDLAPFDHALGALAAVVTALAGHAAPADAAAVNQLITAVDTAFTAVRDLDTALHNSGAAADLAQHLGQLVADLVDYAVTRWLLNQQPLAGVVLTLLGLVSTKPPTVAPITDPQSTLPVYTPQPLARLDLTQVQALMHDPVGTLKAQFTGGSSGAEAVEALAGFLLPLLGQLLGQLGADVNSGQLDDTTLESLSLQSATSLTAGDQVLVIAPPVAPDSVLDADLTVALVGGPDRPPVIVAVPHGDLARTLRLGSWQLDLTATASAGALTVDSAGGVQIVGGDRLSIKLALGRAPTAGAAVVLGATSESHVQVQDVTLNAAIDITTAAYELQLGLAWSGAQLLIRPSGFLAQVLPGQGLCVTLDAAVTWSTAHGLQLTGPGADPGKPGALTLTIPVGLSLGPVSVPHLDLGIAPATGGLQLRLSAGASATLGPFAASLDRVGLAVSLGDAVQADGAPFSVAMFPLLPTAIGLSITSATVTGGGFLSLDPDTGSYAGAVQLHVAGVGVSAVGLLSTKLPDGSPGFSLLVVISAQFPPVQLGFGFALVGLGGLLGVNRTTDVAALQGGLQAGALDSVLFPTDIVARAQRVVSDLGRYFPIATGQYVLGPTVQLTWGAGNLVTATLGIFLELPSPTRVIVAGQVHIAVPTPAAPVVSIELDVLGVIDFTAKQLAIDAVLRNSKVAGFTLTGQAAVRASWGSSPAFLLAAGGFNPGFTPPASFPALQRLQLAIGNGNNPRLRLSAYFALTSNTVQFGARLDLYAGIDIPVVGTFAITGMLSFDALVQFSPFAFTVEIAAGLALSLGGNPLMGIALDLILSGPQPWHAAGTATINFLGSHKVQFAVTSGAAATATPAPQINIATTLQNALTDPANWDCAQPDGGLLIVLAGAGQPAGTDPLVVHPRGKLTVKQRTVPLGIAVTHTGSMRALDPGSHAITRFAVGSRTKSSAVTDWFAPAQFIDLDDAAKLSRPSFEPMTAGATLSGSGVTSPTGDWSAWNQDVDVTTTFLTPAHPSATGAPRPALARPAAATVRLDDDRVLSQLAGSAAAQLGPRTQGSSRFAASGSGIVVRPPTYAVATRRDLSAADANAAGDALTYLPTFTDAAQRQPDISGLQVVETPDVFAPVVVTTPASIDPQASYSITAGHSGKCLDVAGASAADGAPVVQWDYVAAPNQQWRILALGNGCCAVQSVSSQLHLGIAGDDLRNGTAVVQQVPSNGLGQQWRIVQVGTGWYSLQNSLTGRCLDIAGGSQATADGAAAQQWDWYSGENQKWRLDAVPATLLLRQQIRQTAYDDYLARGRTAGHALDDWLRAEAAVLQPLIAVRAYYLYLQRGRGWGRTVDDWLTAESMLRAEIAEGVG